MVWEQLSRLVAGWTKIIAGAVLLTIGGLAALGSAVTGELGALPVVILMLAGGVALVISGRRNIRKAATKKVSKVVITPCKDDIVRQCPNCGASDAPDEDNCCQYCGSRLDGR